MLRLRLFSAALLASSCVVVRVVAHRNCRSHSVSRASGRTGDGTAHCSGSQELGCALRRREFEATKWALRLHCLRTIKTLLVKAMFALGFAQSFIVLATKNIAIAAVSQAVAAAVGGAVPLSLLLH